MENNCPICEGVDSLTGTVSWLDFEYGGVTKILPLHYSLCKICGSEITCYEQSILNKATALEFHQEVDNERMQKLVEQYKKWVEEDKESGVVYNGILCGK